MLNDFFKLNGGTYDINSQTDLENRIATSTSLRNIIYKCTELRESSGFKYLKVSDITFTNVSFSKTLIRNVRFYNCTFTDCLFIGTQIIDCEFYNCKFVEVNTFKISIKNSYIDPKSFVQSIPSADKANIAVYLFQQLLRNSIEQEQKEFSRSAEYYFYKWNDKLLWNKFFYGKPYKIGFRKFLSDYPLSILFRFLFGYGLRFRNFFFTFLLVFVTFLCVNYCNWESYGLQEKDMSIDSFRSDSVTLVSNFMYTVDVTTKLVDSQFQPTTDFGMCWLTFESIISFVLLSALITLIVNRFVR